MLLESREHAGRLLGARLAHLRDQRPVVLGLPRGGVVVAAEIACALAAPLDVLIVRKLPAPHQSELALGAVAGGAAPSIVLNRDIIAELKVDQAYLDRTIAIQQEEVRRREQLYRGPDRPAIPLHDRAVIVVDDGIATGATVRVALQAVRRWEPSRLVLAVPVAAPEALQTLRSEVDELVCLQSPPHFQAVGQFYQCFDQTEDQQVMALLRDAAARYTFPP